MDDTGPLIFVGLMAVTVAVSLLVALVNNQKAYGEEKHTNQRERIAAEGFALTMPAAGAIFAVLFIAYKLFD